MDQRVGIEFESCCSESENRVVAEDGISVEVDEKKSLEEPLSCSVGFQQTCSSDNDGMLIRKSDDISIDDSDRLPRLDSSDAFIMDSPVRLGNKRPCSPVSSDAATVNKRPCNAEELHDEVVETVSIEEQPLALEADVSLELLNGSKGVASEIVSNDAEMENKRSLNAEELHDEATETVGIEEQPWAPEADVSLELLNGSKGVASETVHDKIINIPVGRTLAGYDGKKLLVLDVNGLLVDISSYVPYGYDYDEIINRKSVFKRPHCNDFLNFCFENFNVGVWTSRTKNNVEPILDLLLGKDKCKLLFCWDQSQCTYTGFTTVEKRHKPLLLKKLMKLWNKCDPDLPWERGVYDESNTLLLDDTPYKALCNPQYTAVFPYPYHFKDVRDNSLGPGGDLRVYLEGLVGAENVQEYVKQNPFGQRAITEKNLSWGYYRRVIAACSTPPNEAASGRQTF